MLEKTKIVQKHFFMAFLVSTCYYQGNFPSHCQKCAFLILLVTTKNASKIMLIADCSVGGQWRNLQTNDIVQAAQWLLVVIFSLMLCSDHRKLEKFPTYLSLHCHVAYQQNQTKHAFDTEKENSVRTKLPWQ